MNVKRSISSLMIALTAITLAGVAGGQSQDLRISKKVMEGSWKVIVTPVQSPIPLPPSIEAIVTYIPGGGLTESDNLAVPGSVASSGHGAWEVTEARRFNITLTKYLFTTQGQFQGTVRIKEKITRDLDDSEYTGEGEMEVFDPTGAPVITIPVTTRASRIRADVE